MLKTTRYCLLLLILISFSTNAFSSKHSTRDYIRKYKKLAIAEMKKYRIPASITLAQGILESGNGNSTLARKANNHFGIKCHSDWKGKSMKWTDDKRNECFRKYKKVADSYRDHSKFLTNRGRYSSLFRLKITDYAGWARGLQKAGYATNKKYSTLLIRVIEKNRLYRYDDKKYQRQVLRESDSTLYYEENKSLNSLKFEEKNVPGVDRTVFTNNNVRFIFAKKGETFASIAKELKIYTWQLSKYNDLDKKAKIKDGQILYIQAKKNKAKEKYHIVKKNETLHSISQLYGMKLRKLQKRNKLSKRSTLRSGQRLRLR